MPHRLLAALLSLMLLLAGCSKPSAPVDDPPPPLAPAVPSGGCTEASGAIPIGHVDRPYGEEARVSAGLCEVKVDEAWFDLRFRLPAQTTREQAEAALAVEAPDPPRLYIGSPHAYREVLLRFPPGQPGEVIRVRLAGPVGLNGADADLGYLITRFPSPRIRAELKRSDGDWEPLTGIPVLPRQPLTFRFRLHGGANGEEAKRKIRAALREVAGHQIEQPAPDTLVVAVPEPPPLLFFDFQGVRGEHGTIIHGGATVYTGEPPSLVVLDPGTGEEEPLREAPADLLRASLSPDGNWLMLSGMASSHPWEESVWVMNMQTREMRLTPLRDEAYRSTPVLWLPDRLVLPVHGQVQVWHLAAGEAELRRSDAYWWETASPDGRYIVGVEVDYGRETKQWLAPATLFIHGVEKGTDLVLPDLVQYRVPHKGGYPSIGTIWEEDGRHLLIRHYHAAGEAPDEVQERLMRLEVSTGKAVLSATPVPEPEPYPEWHPGPGGWQVRNSGGWGPVVLRAPDGTEQERGSGLVVGWTGKGRLLLVRWSAEQRRQRWAE